MHSIIGISIKFLKCRNNSSTQKRLKKHRIQLQTRKHSFEHIRNIWKVYLFQISDYFEKILSRYQCDFRKGHSTQQCLLVMIEKWRQSFDKTGHYGALLTDSSKAFDCLSHDLLIAKLHAYGFDIPALTLLHNYLTNRHQLVKIVLLVPGKKYCLVYHKVQF